MKKYKISLALKIPSNFEIEINANSKKDALKKSINEFMYRESNETNITDPDWENIDLDIKENNMDDLDSGINIEKI